MASMHGLVAFTLTDVEQAGRELLRAKPEAIITHRLLREVLRLPPHNPKRSQAKDAVLKSKWVQQLEESQWADGSWGRFHTQDTKVKTMFRTTEDAIDRAFALGLEPGDNILTRAGGYIQTVLQGNRQITDRIEKSESWPLLVNYILAGRLAQIDPVNKTLDKYWIALAEVAQQAFASGNYRIDAEAATYMRLSGVHVPGGFLESQHALYILASRRLPYQLDHALVSWIWHKPDGIRYLRASLQNPPPRHIGYWVRSMNLLSRFSSWREIAVDSANHLWEQRDKDGRWDFGSDVARSIDFPLSDNWRQSIQRKQDYSTCILVLLRKFFD